MENTCVCCGAPIPEGRQVCPQCSPSHGEMECPSEYFDIDANAFVSAVDAANIK